ncbi:helix-turn-helix domain-containing protein [Halomarina oriensis]|uniref:Bacterio-opsin activator n=1 Tax=Halomarina oriensis TaxID=671145 RepID=A0A6B0GLB3_9EURY|nr:helix-turn-helix domain-containing protein [Halomarina oriensis]MWG35652.1 bacterio-opsin activator [Halomarina oriensis]
MIVEFVIQQPTLLDALRSVPSMRVEWEQTDTTANREVLQVFWAIGDDFEAFETALHGDPTVTAPRCLTEFSDRRLYQVEQVGEGRAQSIYPAIVEVGGVIQRCTATSEGWELQVRFPDNDALSHVHDICARHDLDFRLRRKYEEASDTTRSDTFGLTEKQHQMLTQAVEQGYYEVPRKIGLDQLGSELGISHQAASERLRRAVTILTENALSLERDDRPDEGVDTQAAE